MYEKTSKLSVKSVSRKRNSHSRKGSPDFAQGFVALKDYTTKKYYLHDLCDSWSTYDNTTDSAVADGRTMTRKTRTRQPPRLHTAALQSGYCAICHLHYNSLEDHIQSKKHLKLIGDDANFISLNGFLDQDTNFETFLDLDGISVGLNDKTIACAYSTTPEAKSKMPRTRARSVCGRAKPAPPSPVRSETGHHLRSRKQINYASPTTEEDSLPEKPEREVIHHRPRRHINYNNSIIEEDSLSDQPELEKEVRELRSSSRLQAKLTDHENEDVWNSGRPKRTCIRQKRSSADVQLPVENKSYYKVEVVSPKIRSSGNSNKDSNRKRSRSPVGTDNKIDEKGLIVKFKKLRNSELIRLNNEAENFLFPKKEDCSSEDDEDGTITTFSTEKNDNSSVASEFDDPKSPKFKVEDEASMDSTSSESKRKKRRRTHAEAFIMDNQKYYKFETPGSRLRYQGSFLPLAIPAIPKHNGDCSSNLEKHVTETEGETTSFNLDDYKFSFERSPSSELWYKTFERQDKGNETYVYFSDEAFWNPFILPYQMNQLPPIDPKVCISQYQQVKKYLLEPPSSSTSEGTTTPDPTASTSTLTNEEIDEDDDKMDLTNENSCDSVTATDDIGEPKKRFRCLKVVPGKKPRKSPRQHASTLAILSSLINQRKRRSKILDGSPPKLPLSPIPEEQKLISENKEIEDAIKSEEQLPNQISDIQKPPQIKRKAGRKPRINYKAIAKSIDEELSNSFSPELDDIQLEITADNIVFDAKTDVLDVLRIYDESKATENCRGTKRFFNGLSGRKPGRKKKANKTGWPNRIKRMMRKDHPVKDEQDDSTIDSVSVNADSEDNESCGDTNSTDSINKQNVVSETRVKEINKNDQDILSEVNNCDSDRVNVRSECSPSRGGANVVNVNSNHNRTLKRDVQLQPYVRVQKLEREQIDGKLVKNKSSGTPKRTNKHQRRMPASPKSPRMLRKPRGRWYRER